MPAGETEASFLRRLTAVGARDRYRPYYDAARTQTYIKAEPIEAKLKAEKKTEPPQKEPDRKGTAKQEKDDRKSRAPEGKKAEAKKDTKPAETKPAAPAK